MRQGYPRRFAPHCKHARTVCQGESESADLTSRRPEARHPNLGGSGVQRAGEVPNREQSTILARDVANQKSCLRRREKNLPDTPSYRSGLTVLNEQGAGLVPCPPFQQQKQSRLQESSAAMLSWGVSLCA